MFLTLDELCRLTGRKRPSAQRRVLIARGYRFELDGDGRPLVRAEDVTARLAPRSIGRARPRLDLLKRASSGSV